MKIRENDWVRTALIAIALVYALIAGLRLVNETDLGWQMATGRYIVQHRAVPSTVLYNYTTAGAQWIYSALSEVIFYLLYVAGGYAAISWFSALACIGAIALALWRGGRTSAALAIIAVPAMTYRTVPRADLFTTVIFAAVLVLLWRHLEGARIQLWSLPLIMVLWVNLHPGFVAGLALMGAYVFIEACDAVMFPDLRTAAVQRVKRGLPWIAASTLVTLVNPWGIEMYRALRRQGRVTLQLTQFVGEWSSVHFNALSVRQFFSLRDPGGAEWWLMALAALTLVVCILRKRIGVAVLMAGALYESIAHVRFQAMLGLFVIVIGGAILPEIPELFTRWKEKKKFAAGSIGRPFAPVAVIVLFFALFTAVRCFDLVSNRYYIDLGSTTLFGAGESWWFPEKAARFLEREKLPANLFHDYNAGGYLAWRVGEKYPDFADGRFIPFAGEVFLKQRTLLASSPDSALWRESAQRWNINVILLSLSRYAGLNAYSLSDYCHSAAWAPVYVDDVSILLLRNNAENAELLGRLRVNCDNVVLPEPEAAKGNSWRAKAERFNFLLNSASVYYILSRDAEAYGALQQAEMLFPDNESLHLTKAQLLQANGRAREAEQEYLRAVEKRPSDAGWFALAALYNGEKRYADAARCVREAISYSQVPYERLRSLGLVEISMGQPKYALTEFDRADAKSPFREDVSSEEGRSFNGRLAASRAKALRAMNDLPGAIAQQERATQLMPENESAWEVLAELAQAQGDEGKAQMARSRAETLRSASQPAAAH